MFTEEHKLSSSIYTLFPSLPILHIFPSTTCSEKYVLLVWSCQIICPGARPFVTFRKTLTYYCEVLLASSTILGLEDHFVSSLHSYPPVLEGVFFIHKVQTHMKW
jgi:hypothetical protein